MGISHGDTEYTKNMYGAATEVAACGRRFLLCPQLKLGVNLMESSPSVYRDGDVPPTDSVAFSGLCLSGLGNPSYRS